MRTRNFRVRNEILGECYQWKANGQCSKGDSCSFRHDPASGNRCEAQRAKGQSSSPRLTERYPQKVQATEEKALQIKGAESRADTENVITRHVIVGTRPCVKITSLRQDASVAANAVSDTLRRWRSPARSQKNDLKGSVAS